MVDIYLGTIAIEPSRWAWMSEEAPAPIAVSPWLDRIADAGFDGVELWEAHVRQADEAEAAAVFAHPLPVAVFNTYVGFDNEDDTERDEAAEWIRRSGARKAKWNTGPERDAGSIAAYRDRAERFAASLPDVELVCECHDGSAMDDPATAATVLAAGSSALFHSHDDADLIAAKFAAYGERLTHVHVNHLFSGSPKLADIRDELAAKVDLVRGLGFDGSWTVEFVHGTGDGELDQPETMFAQAVEDLDVLRALLV
ncbi:MAG: hypothetical protein AAF548_00840 [Actinomycetota bacterium]